MVSMNQLSTKERAQILALLVEGMSIRGVSRVTSYSKNTINKLLVEVGDACLDYQDKTLRNLSCKRIQCDEIWSFCYAKQKNVPDQFQGVYGYGDVYTWTAICADTKLVPSWLVGRRSAEAAKVFMEDLSSRLARQVQLTTDGHRTYLNAVEGAFGGGIDYAMLVKLYSQGSENTHSERRYSPGECCGAIKGTVCGNPDDDHVSTSFVERQNLTMRMSMRRFTRLTNAFSKKIRNLESAVALHFMYYNFARIHQSLRVTPAMEAGVSDHVWEMEEIVGLLDGGLN